MESLDEASLKAKAQAERLGGGWRLENGILPVVVLTTVEADRLIEILDAKAISDIFHFGPI